MNDNLTPVKPYIVYIPLDKHTALKVWAAKRNISIASIFKDLLDQFFKKENLFGESN